MEKPQRDRANVMGLAVDAIEYDVAVDLIIKFALSRPTHYVCVASVQDIVLAQQDGRFRRIVNQADLVTADGWPVYWSMRRQGFQQSGKVTGPDLMLGVCERGIESDLKHYLYGGASEVPELLTNSLQESYPGINIVGSHSPPFRALTAEEDDRIVNEINQCKADVLWVGISTPKQQYWLEEHIDRLDVGVILTVGAAFDFHSGRIHRAPVWMQNSGLEWLYRFIKEPRRLGPRYVKFIPQYLYLNFANRMGLRSFSIDDCKTVHGDVTVKNIKELAS